MVQVLVSERELVLHHHEAPSVVSSGRNGKDKKLGAACCQEDEMHPAADSPQARSEMWSILKLTPSCTPEKEHL